MRQSAAVPKTGNRRQPGHRMLFNSYTFLFVFLPLTAILFFTVARYSHRAAAASMALASLIFYGWWNPLFVGLLLLSIAFNYVMGQAIDRWRNHSRLPLIAAITINLCALAYYKYANFFVDTLNALSGSHLALETILLPLGISFFTFTQIAFLVDAQRGHARERNPWHYLLFVTYFPHLIAGPVLHHAQMMPQFGLASTYRPDIGNISAGLSIFIIGLFKKIALADHFAGYANPVFDAAGHGLQPGTAEAWAGVLAYTLQLYFDFSGYSDMAVGLSRMFNIALPINFNSPYKATSAIDFWRRWHMTLSAFLRDYLYVPLGGNRKGAMRRYINLLITMVLGGLWHGANWTFVLWGALHGLFLVINHGWRNLCARHCLPRPPGAALLSATLTFVAITLAWIPFRATSIDAATTLLHAILPLTGDTPMTEAVQLGLRAREVLPSLALGLGIVWLTPNVAQLFGLLDSESSTRLQWKFTPRYAMTSGAMLALAILGLTRESPFLYFQF